jgi:hypothetical protein
LLFPQRTGILIWHFFSSTVQQARKHIRDHVQKARKGIRDHVQKTKKHIRDYIKKPAKDETRVVKITRNVVSMISRIVLWIAVSLIQ